MNCPHCQTSLNSFANFMMAGGIARECPQCKKQYVVKNDWKIVVLVGLAVMVVTAIIVTALLGNKPGSMLSSIIGAAVAGIALAAGKKAEKAEG